MCRGQREPGFRRSAAASGLDPQFLALLMELEGDVAGRVAVRRDRGGERLDAAAAALARIGRRAPDVLGDLGGEVVRDGTKPVCRPAPTGAAPS